MTSALLWAARARMARCSCFAARRRRPTWSTHLGRWRSCVPGVHTFLINRAWLLKIASVSSETQIARQRQCCAALLFLVGPRRAAIGQPFSWVEKNGVPAPRPRYASERLIVLVGTVEGNAVLPFNGHQIRRSLQSLQASVPITEPVQTVANQETRDADDCHETTSLGLGPRPL